MDLAYAAGLFDGEGYVRISRWEKPNSPHIRYALLAGINMTYRPIIEQLHAAFGGGTHSHRYDLRNPNQRCGFCWSVASQYAAHFLRQIQPFSVVKKDQIELALEFQAHLDSNPYRPAGRPGPNGHVFRANRDEILAFREDCFNRITAMKHQTFDPFPPRPRGRSGQKGGRPKAWSSLLHNGPTETVD